MAERQLHILLVEDSVADVLLVQNVLTQSGLDFQLQVLEDGEQAVEFIDSADRDPAARCPDVVLLDLNLPKKSGTQVLEQIRQSPKFARVPVVIVTSSDSPADRAQTQPFQATQYFQKPSKLDEFMKLGPLVREVVGRRA